ncbi:DNA mismatch repair protein [Pseudozyma hubeiensis SY62]|uniref:DNA mismatch repair protein n=1 Tax=Pseudozyma hubeiensis (strain SY62) TaxID=1305764 RepID=R9P7P7_PSEHS|nr:DNA mismatch repair protein [Pseudozyma hubeiensis SY62]GAC97371.1 DNA mismatch repair protein [Pseudozyma hubeiensis SY62]
MEPDAALRWRQPQQRAHSDENGRPSTAVSVATSASSFHIPGVRPLVPVITRDLQPMGQQLSPDASFARIFAPQTQDGNLIRHADGQQQSPPLHWLRRHGPSPRELLDTSQGVQNELDAARVPVYPSFGGSNRDPTLDWSHAHHPLTLRPTTVSADDQPRPFTASSYHRNKLVTADTTAGSYVCALIENRGTGREVGIATIERETEPRSSKRPKTYGDGSADSDGGSHAGGLGKSNKSVLIRSIEQLYDIEAKPFPRKHWNYVEDLNAKASTRAAILVAVADKFYLLSALAGLIEFYMETFNRVFTPKTLRIRYIFPEGKVLVLSRAFFAPTWPPTHIDTASNLADTILINSNTAHDLELVRNLIDSKSKDSLYGEFSIRNCTDRSGTDSAPACRRTGLLNHCVSPMGQRLLRTNILQPLTDIDAILVRQEAVAECIHSEERFHAISESFKPIKVGSIDLDKLIHTLSCPPSSGDGTRLETERKIGSVLSLRTLLRSLGPAKFLESADVDEINDAILETVDEDVLHAKGGLGSRHARMVSLSGSEVRARSSISDTELSRNLFAVRNQYAVRAQRSPLLDVARQTYRENLDDIDELKQRLEIEQLRTELDRSQIRELPEYFTNVSRAKVGKSVTMTTLALKKLNARLLDSMNEVCNMSETIIDELIEKVIGQIASLNKVSEALALLDMIVSMAIVSRANDYVRPVLGERLDIRNARHPILDRVDILGAGNSSVVTRRRCPFVPNDIYLAPGERVCLITGPNMSGKSTLLRQVALITVLAGIGCFVPASRATLPIPDALLSLLTHEDDATQNLSTFAAEMRTSAFILSVATPQSLVILDEMGRGTSPDEGCAIATAIVEDLISQKGCTVFYATHFGELVEGFQGKGGVVCQHLDVGVVQRRENVDLVFHHKLHLGPGLNTHYSLQVARMMGCFSDDFLQRARDVALTEDSTRAEKAAELDDPTKERRKVVRNLVRLLRCIEKGAPVGESLEDSSETDMGGDAQSLGGRLARLQLRAVTELEGTYED